MKGKSIASELHRSNLSTFAIVEAQLTKGLKQPSDYLLPFFQEIISREDGKNFVVSEIVKDIYEVFALDIPVYLADSLVHALVKGNYLEYDKEHKCHICHKVDTRINDYSLSDSDFNIVEISLAEYAEKINVLKPLVSSDWVKALLAFFSQNNDRKQYITFNGKIISNPKEQDDRIISKFIVDCEKNNPSVFTKIKIIYTAFTIADTVTYIQNTGHVEDWDTLNLIYDSTVLMRLLGTSGILLKKATLEMHSMLQDMGCNIYYFDHTLSEVYSNIEALIVRYSHGNPIHRETAQALENSEISISNINLLKGSADLKLGKLNITQIDVPPRMQNVLHQVNPQDLENFLKSKINYRSDSVAAGIDAESIEKIVFLRGGKKSTDLPKSRYIFVTHNSRYARVSREYTRKFCHYSNFDTPPIVTLSTLTKLSWLASDKKNPNYDLTRGLLANCFQASLPDDKWYNKFWQTIEESHPELVDTNVHDSLYLLDVRAAAEEASLGNSALFDDIDFSVLIANAKIAREEKEKTHQNQMLNIQRDNDLALQRQINKNDSMKRDYDQRIKEADEKVKIDIDFIKNENDFIKNTELQELEKKHKNELHSSILNAKDEFINSIDDNITIKAEKHARTISKVITFILASFFAVLFILSLMDKLPTWISVEYNDYIKIIAALLGVVQVIGLFVEKFSFLFLGPLFEKHLRSYLEKYYRKMLL